MIFEIENILVLKITDFNKKEVLHYLLLTLHVVYIS